MNWRRLGRRLGDDSGASSVEAVLWIPLFMFFLLLVFDTSMTFMNKSQLYRLTQDANRGFATGRLRTVEDTRAFIQSGAEALGARPTVEVSLSPNVIRSEIRVRAGDLSGVGVLRLISDIELRVATQHLLEG